MPSETDRLLAEHTDNTNSNGTNQNTAQHGSKLKSQVTEVASLDGDVPSSGDEDPFTSHSNVLRFEWEDTRAEVASRLHLQEIWDTCEVYPEWQRRLLIKEIGSAYLRYSIPLHILEYRITMIAMRLHERVRLSHTSSGALLILFCEEKVFVDRPDGDKDANREYVELVPAGNKDVNLAKMVDVEKVADSIINGQSCRTALKRLIEIRHAPDTPWPKWAYIPAAVGFVVGYGPLYNGAGVYETLCAALVTLIVSSLEVYWSVFHRVGLGKQMLVAFLAASGVAIFHIYIQQINVMNAIMTSLTCHLPGLALTNALTHVVFGYNHVGAHGLVQVLVVSANLGVGVIGGLTFVGSLSGHIILPSLAPVSQFAWYIPHISIVLSLVPTVILNKGKLSHLHWYALGTFAAYYGTQFGHKVMGIDQFASCVGATVTGVIANAYGNYTDSGPAIELVLISIIAIVPGSFTLNFTTAMDTASSISLARDMMIVALSIVTGQFISCAILPPKRQL
ncbi:hypothetical protein SARC_11128 [Sphaeroforma arctica JP610]|uniref:Threonine/serine exporter-like N-terminal domain-containing protein n=1 Tax=Sphaeroforma arctica JP610 TaxID=667725 RepID=A0A0L0FHX7_9EUKA|nr:hypothetical protein SARC_11128 [Sphaeroforma arctica JP610]KNC76365.1 hypothetical protein SARC_11128 [Sphaeroforma arctica JP610]|eukprot:XP_014150267.1 hypothetical protein SARC_11128 [Sphaeroforma arctica JP610]